MATELTRYRGTNLHQEHLDAWDRLAAHAGLNPNQFIRWLLLNLTEADIDRMFRRGTV